jgi:glycosyl transferase family 25
MSMIDDLVKEGIYIMHALTGYEYHEKRIVELFNKNKLGFELMTDGDPIHFTKDLLEKYFVSDIGTKLSKGVLSCTLNHILSYEKIVTRKNRYAVVFENDPFFLVDFKEQLEKMAGEIDKLDKGFIISLENSTLKFPSYWQTTAGKYLYPATMGRMAGAYLIDLEGATRIVNDLKQNKCHTVIDWWHNSLLERGVVKMYWAHPPLVEQGSHNGHLSSTISTKPSAKSRRIKWLIQKNYKYYFMRLFNEERILD